LHTIPHSFKILPETGQDNPPAACIDSGPTVRLPRIINAEWNLIAPHLPPSHGPGKPRQDDRRYVSALFYAEACYCFLESLPGYANPRSLRTRRQRWEADGTLSKLMEAGAPVIARMRADYYGMARDASIKHSSEFFGRGLIPKLPHTERRGRHADRRRRVPAG
jgi:transposase